MVVRVLHSPFHTSFSGPGLCPWFGGPAFAMVGIHPTAAEEFVTMRTRAQVAGQGR